mmetsp:Transcript_7209/g.15382  ORF Transcript_7209/g.15382 Transcript_7209/m.15382 type:complete len:148 (+) Transcript_7209:134-577(+)
MSDDDTNNDNNSSQNAIFLKRIAGAMGASGVAMGAFGAHALKKALDQRGTAAMWQTATTYQLFHATAILSLATTAASLSSSSLPDPMSLASNKQHLMAGKLMGIGNLLFSGSIYCLALGIGPKKILGPITPIGGLLMIGGWVVVGMT